ncbi:hypothetical protein AC249_AIPGENE17473 [Exaiptasia diaphana]|nr:hypothetical protein AC249_AIPGENE17473 [Exaiptasia diaphana]
MTNKARRKLKSPRLRKDKRGIRGCNRLRRTFEELSADSQTLLDFAFDLASLIFLEFEFYFFALIFDSVFEQPPSFEVKRAQQIVHP